MVKSKTNLLVFLSLFCLVGCSTSPSGEAEWLDEFDRTNADRVLVKPRSITQELGDFHTLDQEAVIRSSYNAISSFGLDGSKEASKPRGVIFESEDTSMNYIEIADNSSFDNSKVSKLNAKHQYTLQNVFKNKKYYYRYSATTDFSQSVTKEVITCKEGPRNLDVGGVSNVRDLGGYTSKLGGTIKQGLYFRGAAPFGSTSSINGKGSINLSDTGLETFTVELGIKSQVDFRMDASYFDTKGSVENGNQVTNDIPGVTYYSCPINWDTDNMLRTAQTQIKDAFKVYTVEANYPVYVHCSIGTDRTGMFSYLMGALLGMSYEDLFTDYLFSMFGYIKGTRDKSTIENYEKYFKTFGGKTLAECVENYLLEIGITRTEIDTVRSIMLEQ